MQFRTGLIIFQLLFTGLAIVGQNPANKITKEEYIILYKDIAVEEMNIYRIPASITLAQGILESGSGNSTLARKANNHFGIKCHAGWNGQTFHMDDDAENECFRKYDNPYESFKDHSIFLTTRDRYSFLFELEITDYQNWAHGLKNAGYATNPKYPQLLIGIIEEYKLHQYDKLFNPVFSDQKSPAIHKTAQVRNNRKTEDFSPIVLVHDNRQIFEKNGVKYTLARQGDNFNTIAEDFNIYAWQVRSYNEMKKKDRIYEGQVIYLERKNNKGVPEFHTVNPGEDLRSISQDYAIRLKKLCKLNTLEDQAKLYPGQKIKLR